MLLTWTSSVVKNSPASAGDTGSTPSLGRFHMPQSSWAHVPQLLKTVCPPAHIPQPLSLRAAATEALVPRVCTVQQEKPLQWEARAPQIVATRLLQLEKTNVQQQRPRTTKKKIIIIF